jgi:hypothetical protein
MSGRPTASASHLVTVWNPSYARNAMDEHLQLLLDLARDGEAGRRPEDDIYVWWGKVRSSNRQQPLIHKDEILALDGAISSEREMDLYLTDYQSLYVGDVVEITGDDVSADDAAHLPDYYRREKLSCDCWFKLADIRLLVASDMAGVTHELSKLRNRRYHDRPVSIYGGMVELPLIVTRPDGDRFFDPVEQRHLIGDARWAEWDREHSAGVGEMERELRENHFGEKLWSALDASARRFIATAESAFRAHRADSAYDFAQSLGSSA